MLKRILVGATVLSCFAVFAGGEVPGPSDVHSADATSTYELVSFLETFPTLKTHFTWEEGIPSERDLRLLESFGLTLKRSDFIVLGSLGESVLESKQLPGELTFYQDRITIDSPTFLRRSQDPPNSVSLVQPRGFEQTSDLRRPSTAATVRCLRRCVFALGEGADGELFLHEGLQPIPVDENGRIRIGGGTISVDDVPTLDLAEAK